MLNKKKAVAIFDFDGTLTYRHTTLAFLYYTAPYRFYCLMPLLLPILFLYLINIISIDQLNKWLCYSFFKGKSKTHLNKIGRDFALNKLPTFIRMEAMLKLKEHQKNAHPCILATAAYDLYIKAWGDIHGFSEVLCTETEYDRQGILTGKIKGKSCYGTEKVNKLNGYYQQLILLFMLMVIAKVIKKC